MVNGVTKSGFAFAYDPARLDDMRFVDVLAVVVDDEADMFARVSASSRLTEMLLGKELKAALYDHIGKSHEDRVPRETLEAELGEIMAAAGKDAEKNL